MPLAGRIHDRLELRFGRSSVFFDQSKEERAGQNFPQKIATAIQQARTILAVIGPSWATIQDETGTIRLHRQDDVVRWEVSYALQLGKDILPVLVGGAQMPRPEQLPEDIRAICWIEAITVRSDRDFHNDIERLCALLRRGVTRFAEGDPLTALHLHSRGELDDQRRWMNAALDDPTSIKFPGNPLRDVIEYLSVVHQLPILIDDQSFADSGITPDEEVSIVLHGWPLRRALSVLLAAR